MIKNKTQPRHSERLVPPKFLRNEGGSDESIKKVIARSEATRQSHLVILSAAQNLF